MAHRQQHPRRIRAWNYALGIIFGLTVGLAIISWPSPFPEFFVQWTPASFQFSVQWTVPVYPTFPNGSARGPTVNKTITVANGAITLNAKGGISVDNPTTTENITLYLVTAQVGSNLEYHFQFDNLTVSTEGAYQYPFNYTSEGFPNFANMTLTPNANDTRFTAQQPIEFFESGNLNATSYFKNAQLEVWNGYTVQAETPLFPNMTSTSPKVLQVSAPDITISAENGAYTLSLTWLVIGVSCLALRKSNS